MQFYGKRKITLIFSNYNLAFFCLFSLSSNAACSSIPCTMSLKMVVLFKDSFILLMYKIWGRNKLHQSCLCPFKYWIRSKTQRKNHNVQLFWFFVCFSVDLYKECKSDYGTKTLRYEIYSEPLHLTFSANLSSRCKVIITTPSDDNAICSNVQTLQIETKTCCMAFWEYGRSSSIGYLLHVCKLLLESWELHLSDLSGNDTIKMYFWHMCTYFSATIF